jgi:hypothetical protein
LGQAKAERLERVGKIRGAVPRERINVLALIILCYRFPFWCVGDIHARWCLVEDRENRENTKMSLMCRGRRTYRTPGAEGVRSLIWTLGSAIGPIMLEGKGGRSKHAASFFFHLFSLSPNLQSGRSWSVVGEAVWR